MKAIMKIIKPKTCASIMNLSQSILVIKNKREATAIQKLINKNGFANIYGYCSKDIKNLLHRNCADIYWVEDKDFQNKNKQLGIESQPILNGKVLFKFRCYKVEEIAYQRVYEQNPFHFSEEESGYGTETLNAKEFKRRTCLTDKELEQYLNTDKPNKYAYAIHISGLEVFDEPKELSEFRKSNTPSYEQTKPFAEIFGGPYTQEDYKKQCERFGFVLTKAPQNFCYIEEN